MSEWTPEQVADIRNALAIIRNAVLDGDNLVHQPERLDRYLTNHDSAARTASGAVKVSGLLLEYIRQLQQQHQDIVTAVFDHYDPQRQNRPEEALAPKMPAEVLDFVESRLPSSTLLGRCVAMVFGVVPGRIREWMKPVS